MTARRRHGFTLIELLVVIAIIGLLSTIAIVALTGARAKGRDARRATDIDALKKATELYFNDKGNYISVPAGANDCNGSGALDTALAELVTAGYLGRIPHDPTSPNNPDPYCYQYFSDHSCGIGDGVHPYVIVFGVERSRFELPNWNNEANRYCVHS